MRHFPGSPFQGRRYSNKDLRREDTFQFPLLGFGGPAGGAAGGGTGSNDCQNPLTVTCLLGTGPDGLSDAGIFEDVSSNFLGAPGGQIALAGIST